MTTIDPPAFLDLPDPSPLTYNCFSEFAEDSPALHIQLNSPTHTILQLAIPYDTLGVMMALNEHPDREFYRLPILGTPTPLTNAEARKLDNDTLTTLHTAIQRTLDVYQLLHGIS